MTLFDWYAGGLNVIIIALCEVIGIAWIYGMNAEIYIIYIKLPCVDGYRRLIAYEMQYIICAFSDTSYAVLFQNSSDLQRDITNAIRLRREWFC